jgi:hypothetical protein
MIFKEHTAADLQDRLIRIEGPVKVPTGRKVLVIADDEQIMNCLKIELTILPTEVITAKLTLGHIGPMMLTPEGGTHSDVTTETFETTDVEVRLSAYVEAVN